MFCELPQFARCCLCMPLRWGVLTFGYLNIIFSMFGLGVYSYSVHSEYGVVLVYRGVATPAEAEICIALYCVDILFNVSLVYGAHKQIVSHLRIFYYYTLTMTFAVVIMEIVSLTDMRYYFEIELITFFLVGLCIHLYLLFLVRSLLQKMDNSGCAYENQLHQFVNGELKVEGSGIYPSTVVPIENA
ncbi:unnamed protein product, partial [Brenthis ino]